MTAYNFSRLVPDSIYPARWAPGTVQKVEFDFALSGALVQSDTITTPANGLPSNSIRIADIEMIHPRLDTNATPTGTYNVGDSGSAARFISSANMGASLAGAQLHNNINVAQALSSGNVSAGPNYLYDSGSSPQLILTVNAAVATGATTGTIRCIVTYYCTEEN